MKVLFIYMHPEVLSFSICNEEGLQEVVVKKGAGRIGRGEGNIEEGMYGGRKEGDRQTNTDGGREEGKGKRGWCL